MLMDCHISNIYLSELSESHIIDHCRYRMESGASPATINHDVSYLTSVIASAKPVYGINYTSNPSQEARPLLIKMGLIGKSNRRSRRPVNDELDRLIEGLCKRANHRAAHIPYLDILNISILSCMRIGEVCKIRWDDINKKQKSVIVRDRKDPRKKAGNHMSVLLLGEAWEIVQRQPRKGELIFPYNSRSVSAGFSIEEVAQVTGHRSLNVLWQVYTELLCFNKFGHFGKGIE
ncbi:integrase [Xenorhabdus budapestensis]|uniref:Integrase n=1 Tax=Xenorhabdus budapestensis TaxID=290110 RepID=A0A2D0IQJ5_XENBU|nr:integrase [Xenorhabdus budapestensis]